MLDLHSTLLNDGRYTLIPEPELGFDGTDGMIRIFGKRPVIRPPRVLPFWFQRTQDSIDDLFGRATNARWGVLRAIDLGTEVENDDRDTSFRIDLDAERPGDEDR